jgi:hypothetical protein
LNAQPEFVQQIFGIVRAERHEKPQQLVPIRKVYGLQAGARHDR